MPIKGVARSGMVAGLGSRSQRREQCGDRARPQRGRWLRCFGCANGLVLAGARMHYAMSHDGVFFRSTGNVNPRHRTPTLALWVQTLWTCLLALSGAYSDLGAYG